MENKTENKTVAKKEDKTFLVKGTLISAYFGKTKYSQDEKYRITVDSENIPYEKINAYDNAGDRLTPKWFKDRTGFINVSSKFKVPVADDINREMSFDELITGADVCLKCINKDGAVYPIALKVYKNGELTNPFEDM